VPAITYHLLNMENPPALNVKGMAIGNGLTDPFQQYPAYAKFSYENNLISKEWRDVLDVGFKACQGLILESQHGPKTGPKVQLATLEFCQILAESVLGNPLKPKFNVYDIRIPCESPPLCYDFTPMDSFLNRADVQQVLGVDMHWAEVNQMVHTFLLGDWMTNLVSKVGSILDNNPDVEVLVYSGDKDWICNWRGGEAWTLATHWNSHADFNKQEFESWTVDGKPAGEMRQYGNLHFLRVFDAGHMVPMDQPANALAMLDRFLRNDWNLTTPTSFL
jgi:cathepsin A (carboxypeptidase C)